MHPEDEEKAFAYSTALIHQPESEMRDVGLKILNELLNNYPQNARQYIYLISVAHYHNRNFLEAKRYVKELLRMEPNNLQAIDLFKKIENELSKGILSN